MILAGDFNSNVVDFQQNKKAQNFVNLMFQFGLVPTTNSVLLNLPTTRNQEFFRAGEVSQNKSTLINI